MITALLSLKERLLQQRAITTIDSGFYKIKWLLQKREITTIGSYHYNMDWLLNIIDYYNVWRLLKYELINTKESDYWDKERVLQ